MLTIRSTVWLETLDKGLLTRVEGEVDTETKAEDVVQLVIIVLTPGPSSRLGMIYYGVQDKRVYTKRGKELYLKKNCTETFTNIVYDTTTYLARTLRPFLPREQRNFSQQDSKTRRERCAGVLLKSLSLLLTGRCFRNITLCDAFVRDTGHVRI